MNYFFPFAVNCHLSFLFTVEWRNINLFYVCLVLFFTVWEIIGLVPEVASNISLWEENRFLLWKMLLFCLKRLPDNLVFRLFFVSKTHFTF